MATERNKLPTYIGDRFYCENCQALFRDGDLIVAFGSFVFCYPLDFGLETDCYKRWMKNHRIHNFEFSTMKYHGNT